jgi:DNA-binding protein YbaB
MFGKFGDILSKLKELKERSEEVKKSLESKTIRSEENGIGITMNGNRKILSISLPPDTPGKTELEEKLMNALNKAISDANAVNEDEMKKIAGSLLPGLNF